MNVYYVCKGPVRGSCGHKHRTGNAALECLRQDWRKPRAKAGWSRDREVFQVADGVETQVSGVSK